MTATNKQIVAEAERRWEHDPVARDWSVTDYIIEVTREGWKPPEPVDPDVLAFEEWFDSKGGGFTDPRSAYLAGARMARAQECEAVQALVQPAEAIVNRAVHGTGANEFRWPHILKAAQRLQEGLNAYKAGRAAR